MLQGVSLSVQPNSITCLLGSNGSGKTTLVRSILGLTPPRAGRILFNGTDITRIPTPLKTSHRPEAYFNPATYAPSAQGYSPAIFGAGRDPNAWADASQIAGEAPGTYPMSERDWRIAHDMFTGNYP